MDWVLNNLDNVIIPVIIMILYGLGSFAQKKGKKGETKVPRARRAPQDPEEVRRVEQIQKEIRRKIAERTGRVPPPPPQKHLPASRSVVRQSTPPNERQRFPEPARRSIPPPITTSVFPAEKHQREIEAKMKLVRELEARVKTIPTATDWGAREPRKALKGHLRSSLFQDLAHPLGQKKAILMGEILGAPVGIKGPSGWKPNV